ncbi:MAG: AAA family ATPase [Acidobacteriaceae bacterium]|nr:AAA family ATPase [Acidobacteriaceae bacterium]
MKRFILTGAPGAGKTAILRQLEIEGFGVVEEAATDVIALAQAQDVAEPWTDSKFIDAVADLQGRRVLRASAQLDHIQFHDRSLVCTAALATYLGHPVSPTLSQELDRIQEQRVYEQKVFFVRNLGFIAPTAARRISFDETLRFEKIHEDTYRNFGFELVFIKPGPVAERVNAIKQAVEANGAGI